MCRISYIPKPVVMNSPEVFIINFLKALEAANGGHGNGFYYLESGRLEKSVDVPIEELYNNPKKEGFLFHTRRRSHGPINDFLCHPFETENYIILHNGIWVRYKDFKDLFKNEEGVSDSYVMSKTIELIGMKKFFETYTNLGVVIIYHKKSKRVYCAYTLGEFQVMNTIHGCIYASNFGHYRENKDGNWFKYLKGISQNWIKDLPYGLFELSDSKILKLKLEKLEIDPPKKTNQSRVIENRKDDYIKAHRKIQEQIEIINNNLSFKNSEIDSVLNEFSAILSKSSVNINYLKQDMASITHFLKQNFGFKINNLHQYSNIIQKKISDFYVLNENGEMLRKDQEGELENKYSDPIEDDLENEQENEQESILYEIKHTHERLKIEIEKKHLQKIREKVSKNGKISFNV